MNGNHGVQRIFVSWEKPLLPQVADHLASRHADLDLSSVSVVVSGRRASRRLLALLVDRAESRGCPLVPPDIITPGTLADQLLAETAPVAGDLARKLAWCRALSRLRPEHAGMLVRDALDRESVLDWMATAERLDDCRQELAGAMLSIGGVHEQLDGRQKPRCRAWWSAAAKAEAGYLAELESLRLSDAQELRNRHIDERRVQASRRIVLAGITDLNAQLRRMLSAVADRVEVLVWAPESEAARFDGFGCPLAEAWCGAPLDLAGASIRIAEGPADQAREVFLAIARRGDHVRCDQVTIGVPDESLVTRIQTEAQRLDGVKVRHGAGAALAGSRPFRMLRAVADYIDTRTFHALATLVRHPDVLEWLSDRRKKDGGRSREWVSLMDRYQKQYLPWRLDAAARRSGAWRPLGPRLDSEARDRKDLAWLYGSVDDLVGPLDARGTDTVASCEAAVRVLQQVYGGTRRWKKDEPSHHEVIEACVGLQSVFAQLHATAGLGAGDGQAASGREVLRIGLRMAEGTRITPLQTGDEIEMVGWLELPADDAEVLIITSFNEGNVPGFGGSSLPLAEQDRRALVAPDGSPALLAGDEDHHARDAYHLTAMVASRPRGSVTLIAGRKSGDGDPLTPSRLLFACEPSTVVQRVRQFISAGTGKDNIQVVAYGFKCGSASGFKTPVALPPPAEREVPEKLRVTAFADYLRSPMYFYLRHVLGLDTVEVPARELSAAGFGSLGHEALHLFRGTEAAASTDEHACREQLFACIDAAAERLLGPGRSAVVKLQLQALRSRLASFARWHVSWRRQGWQIDHSEWEPKQNPSLEVDGSPMRLTGRVDRIDRNERTGEWAILDYKFGRDPDPPDRAHGSKNGWNRSLQLPLYRHLVAELGLDSSAQLGFVILPDDPRQTREALADWSEQKLAEADEAARNVVRRIRNREYDDPGEKPPNHGSFKRLFGEGVIVEAAQDTNGEAG